ncbi:MAG: tripartite tricarboxylate transporter substrate binding protein [Rhizobiaceae bacterium]|jgi:tripartite-type tricarboxylate transporter receptor subunit TctC
MFRRTFLAASAALAALVLSGPAAWAQKTYPDKPVTVIVAYSPGGANDTIGRLFADSLTKRTGQQFLVQNVTGANGSTGTAEAARAPADGYHLVLSGPSALIQNPYLQEQTGFDDKSFAPIAKLATLDFVLVVRKDLGIKTVEELVKHSKDHADTLNYGSPGVGNTAHQIGELLKARTGADITHVAYQGGAPAVTAFLAGEVDVLFNTVSEVMPYIQSGDAIPLATFSGERLTQLPDVPTISEAGVENATFTSWIGLFTPAGTPQEVIDFLSAEVSAIIEDKAVTDKLNQLGFRVGNDTPANLAADIEAQKAPLRELIDLTREK